MVTVGDDGQGIDWSRVRDKARELGLPSDTDAALRHALFSDGVSTRDTVTEVSGRGIGLGAVAHQTRRMGGAIEVASTLGEGTTFTIRVVPRCTGRRSNPIARLNRSYESANDPANRRARKTDAENEKKLPKQSLPKRAHRWRPTTSLTSAVARRRWDLVDLAKFANSS